jgi:hypothetical protein
LRLARVEHCPLPLGNESNHGLSVKPYDPFP